MPEEGLKWLPKKELLDYEEMLRACRLLTEMGIRKIRITGGEPFVRKDIMNLLNALSGLKDLEELTITTNGVLTAPLVPDLKKIGVKSVNLSLDTLDRERFQAITHRDDFPRVMETLDQLLKHGIPVKLNAVVMEGKNTEDIIPLVELTKTTPISMRFIEEMPFNGQGSHYAQLAWDHVRILNKIREKFPSIKKIPDPPSSTAYNYHIPGYRGDVGIIAAYTRSFCGTCNRIRITPQGILKTCLYDDGVLNIKELFRKGLTDQQVESEILGKIHQRAVDGWEAEKIRKAKGHLHESMAMIGG